METHWRAVLHWAHKVLRALSTIPLAPFLSRKGEEEIYGGVPPVPPARGVPPLDTRSNTLTGGVATWPLVRHPLPSMWGSPEGANPLWQGTGGNPQIYLLLPSCP
jgi:hypothetical protein